MQKFFLATTVVASLTVASFEGLAAVDEVILAPQDWTFNGFTGGFDRQQLQRGFQIHREICAACHSLNYIAFRNLGDLGYSEAQIKALAAEYELEDGPDEEGDMFYRAAVPSDYFPGPYPNDNFARASNNGSLPPDLSLITKARVGGPDYLYNLLLAYEEPPPDVEVVFGMEYNSVFSGGQIAMPQQLFDDLIEYADGTPATADQMARDVTAFLHWAAEPKLEVRKTTGIRVILFTLVFTILAYFLKRRVWSRLDNPSD